MRKHPQSVDEYISLAPERMRPKLAEVRRAILSVAPDAAESISYGMPYYSQNGRLAWFGLHTNHIGLYLRPPVIEKHKVELGAYELTKSSVHLPLDRKIPTALIRRLVRTRMKIDGAAKGRRGAKPTGPRPTHR